MRHGVEAHPVEAGVGGALVCVQLAARPAVPSETDAAEAVRLVDADAGARARRRRALVHVHLAQATYGQQTT